MVYKIYNGLNEQVAVAPFKQLAEVFLQLAGDGAYWEEERM